MGTGIAGGRNSCQRREARHSGRWALLLTGLYTFASRLV